MNIRIVALVASLLTLVMVQGCAVQKELVSTGGSRADGTVKLSYEYSMFEQPKINKLQGLSVATQRCAAWGYTGAEPFGGGTKTCTNRSTSGCNAWMVTVEYQCTGTPAASR